MKFLIDSIQWYDDYHFSTYPEKFDELWVAIMSHTRSNFSFISDRIIKDKKPKCDNENKAGSLLET